MALFSTGKKSVNSSGNNTTGNSSNSKSSSGSNGRSNNFNGSPKEQEVNLPVGGRLFHHKQVWKELGLPNFCQEVVNGLKIHLLPNFKPIPNSIPFSISEGPKSHRGEKKTLKSIFKYLDLKVLLSTDFRPCADCITKEVQDLLLDDAIEQILPNRYSKRVFYSNVFTVPKPGTILHRPVLDLKRLKTYINNQSFKMEGIENLPSMVKQGYYMVKLDIKKAYLHVLVDPQYRDLFRFVWKGSHYRWKTIPFGLSTALRIFTMLLRPVLRRFRDINISVIAYLDDLLTVGSTKEECLSNLKKTIDLLVKLGFKLNLEKSVLEPTQSITLLGLQIDSVSMKLLSNQELQLATEEGSVQSNPTSVRSNPDGSVRISPEPSNVQLLNNQNECTPPRLESMEAMSGLPTTHSFAFYPGENELIQFEEGFYNTDLPNLEISNLVSDYSSSSSSSSSSYVSSSSGNIPRSIDQTISRVNTNSNSTTLETGDYSTFQSHSSTAELLIKSWEPSTIKVYSSSYTRNIIDLGIIKKSESNYSSPIMLLKRRDSWRVVHDYRQLNKVTVRNIC
ncbi:hypothetical protein ACTFIW_008749 [Dictyostelium discoideum]